jgi:hypothetical protein
MPLFLGFAALFCPHDDFARSGRPFISGAHVQLHHGSGWDVVLTLRHPNQPLAVWNDDDEPLSHQHKPNTESNCPDEDGPFDTDEGAADKPLTFLVSLKHLILASPVLKAMLTGGWREGIRHNGRLEIEAEGWDAEALAIVMRVVHGQNRQAPRVVTLELLAKIAVIVDYYQVHEAFLVLAPMWIRSATEKVPTLLCRDLMLWIMVSWVFGAGDVFQQATRVAVLRSKGDVEISPELPIPPPVLGKPNPSVCITPYTIVAHQQH